MNGKFCPDDGTKLVPRRAQVKSNGYGYDCDRCKAFWLPVTVAGSPGIVNVKA